MDKKPIIIPIAGGKGGVGKSILAANLAVSLAEQGYSIIAIDLDLGASNLHTCLGIPNVFPGIGDYLKTGDMRLSDLFVKTGIPNLKFLPGDGRTPFMADISYELRYSLIKEVKKIEADFIILDLGAGSGFTTLNFFALSTKGMIVTTFETSSIMNSVMFLRNFILREISKTVYGNKQVSHLINNLYKQSIKSNPLTIKSIIMKIENTDPELAQRVVKVVSKFRPRFIFNMCDGLEDLKVTGKIDSILKQGLSVNAEFFGCVFFDQFVRKSSKSNEILLLKHSDSRASRCIKHASKKISEQWEDDHSDSVSLFVRETIQLSRDLEANETSDLNPASKESVNFL